MNEENDPVEVRPTNLIVPVAVGCFVFICLCTEATLFIGAQNSGDWTAFIVLGAIGFLAITTATKNMFG